MDLASQWNFGDGSNFDFSLPLVNNLHPTKITRQTFSLSAGNSPIPSPSCPIFNLELIDIRPNFQLMTNLPYLRLRSILEHPGTITSRLPTLFPKTNCEFQDTTPCSYILYRTKCCFRQPTLLSSCQLKHDEMSCLTF